MSATTNDSVVELMNENTRLLARVAELEKALAPFAEVWDWDLDRPRSGSTVPKQAFANAAQMLRKEVPNAHV